MIRLAILVLICTAQAASAQVRETPVPFDSAGRVRSITPSLAERFGLVPPVWPVQGAYTQARLFAVSTGGHVLVAELPDGSVERHALDQAGVDALRSAIDASVTVIGGRVGEDRPDVISEPARGAFLRNQMILAAGLYGPLLAAMTDDAKTGTAMYLIAVGGSYFALNSISRTTSITRAQNDLATDGALRGAGTAVGLLRAFAGDDVHRKTYSGIALGGAIAGSTLGYIRGRGLTDSEAHAAMKWSTFAAGTALGLSGAAGFFDDGDTGDDSRNERVVAGATVAAGLAGYLLGPNYPRRARYAVTAGDVRVLPIGAIVGALLGTVPFIESEDERMISAGATAGWLTGIYVADRVWARPYDYGSGHVTQAWLGTIAGGLLGGALIVLTEPDTPVAALSMVAGGAALGAAAGHALANPPRAGQRRAWRFTPENAVWAAARVPGAYPIVSVGW